MVHDFHLSKTDIHYKSDQQSLQITIHSFIDDIELALQEYSDDDMKLFQASESLQADSILQVYFQDHFTIHIDGEPIAYEYLGREESDDIMGIYTYLEILGVTDLESFVFSNTILLDTYDDQKNITVVKADNKPKAFHILSRDDHQKTVEF